MIVKLSLNYKYFINNKHENKNKKNNKKIY